MKIPMLSLVTGVADAMDLVSQTLADHHRRVALVASYLADEIVLDDSDRDDLIWAALLHDSGGLCQSERLDAMRFELEEPSRHAEVGYHLIRSFPPLAGAARLVRYHHRHWDYGQGKEQGTEQVPIGSFILHLADRIAVLLPGRDELLAQSGSVREKIIGWSGKMFDPQVVEAFLRVSERESFWLDVAEPRRTTRPGRELTTMVKLDLDGLEELARLFGRIIDFRSRFTATHSVSVAAVAAALASKAGFSEIECRLMSIAGLVHDLGKLAVPAEILEKPGFLSTAEFSRIKGHTYYTYRVLESIPGLQTINAWASYHHEHLDGRGYPFHLSGQGLDTGARIMAVADVFTALNEDRPYRPGMTPYAALAIQDDMVRDRQLDADLVDLLGKNLEEIGTVRHDAGCAANCDFRAFHSEIERHR